MRTLGSLRNQSPKEAPDAMLHVGLDLSRHRVDVHILDEAGETLKVTAAPPDRDGLTRLSRDVECLGGKGLAPLARKTDRIDAWVLAELSRRDFVPAIWLPDPAVRAERERARYRLHLVQHRVMFKNRVHAALIAFGKPCPVSDLFAVGGRDLLARLEFPNPGVPTSRLPSATSMTSAPRSLPARLSCVPWEPITPTCRCSPPCPGWPGCSATRLRRRSATSPASLHPKARRLHRPVSFGQAVWPFGPPGVAREERPQVPALGSHRGVDPRGAPPRLRGALPAHPSPARTPAGRQSGPRRGGPQTGRSRLAHADQVRTLRSSKVGGTWGHRRAPTASGPGAQGALQTRRGRHSL